MKRIIAALAALALGACGAGFSSGTSRSTYTYDDGVHPPQRVTYTSSGAVNGASVGLAGGFGLGAAPYGAIAPYGAYGIGGYGYAGIGGADLCLIHPDYCGTTISVVTPVSRPAVYAGAPAVSRGRDPALEARVSRVERKAEVNRQVLVRDHRNRKVVLGYLGSALTVNRNSCEELRKRPESLSIDGDEELTAQVRAQVLAKCDEILGSEGGRR